MNECAWINKEFLAEQFAHKCAITKDAALSLINASLNKQPLTHKEECERDYFAKEVCVGMYNDRIQEKLELVEALKAVRTLVGEDSQVVEIINAALSEEGEE